MQNRMTEQKGAGNGKREEKEGNDCGNGLNDILVPFMVYYLVADIGMPVLMFLTAFLLLQDSGVKNLSIKKFKCTI